jgi:hypothetical protein
VHFTKTKTNPGALVARAMTAAFVVALVGLGLDGRQEASAYPPFAKKENKPCTFCHLKPNGGARNEAGKYYKTNGLSLKGYPGLDAGAKPAAAKPAAAKPAAKKPAAKKPVAKKPVAKKSSAKNNK